MSCVDFDGTFRTIPTVEIPPGEVFCSAGTLIAVLCYDRSFSSVLNLRHPLESDTDSDTRKHTTHIPNRFYDNLPNPMYYGQ